MITRRRVLQGLGVSIALPLIEPELEREARAQTAGRKRRFIGCFFPSGAPMPNAANGDWRYGAGGALQPLADLGVQANVAVLRGFRAVNNFDVHWSGTAGFLSSTPVGTTSAANPTSDPNYQKCATSFDQVIASSDNTSRIRSLHAGYSQLGGWDEGHDRAGSINYVNSIAWSEPTRPITNMTSAAQMFTRVFGNGNTPEAARAIYLLKRRKSILDGVIEQYKNHQSTLSAADRTKLDAYAQSIREVEGEIAAASQSNNCARPDADGSGEAYYQNFRTMHRIAIQAMQCNLTRAATFMYNDGIGPNRPTNVPAAQQHDSAHNNWGNLIQIVQVQVRLFGELILGLRNANLLGDTVLLLGSNMSDGRTHNAANIPLLLASQNTANELKLGGEVLGVDAGSVANFSANRNLSDIFVDLGKLYGLPNFTQFGAGAYASTGRPSGILA